LDFLGRILLTLFLTNSKLGEFKAANFKEQ
jgi:hypothetical protein